MTRWLCAVAALDDYLWDRDSYDRIMNKAKQGLRFVTQDQDFISDAAHFALACFSAVLAGLEAVAPKFRSPNLSLVEIVGCIQGDPALEDAFLTAYWESLHIRRIERFNRKEGTFVTKIVPDSERGFGNPFVPGEAKVLWFEGKDSAEIVERFIFSQVQNQQGRLRAKQTEAYREELFHSDREEPSRFLGAYGDWLVESMCEVADEEVSATERTEIINAVRTFCEPAESGKFDAKASPYHETLARVFASGEGAFFQSTEAKAEGTSKTRPLLNESRFELSLWLAAWISAHRVGVLDCSDIDVFVKANFPSERQMGKGKPTLAAWARRDRAPFAASQLLGEFWCGSFHILWHSLEKKPKFVALKKAAPISLNHRLMHNNIDRFGLVWGRYAER